MRRPHVGRDDVALIGCIGVGPVDAEGLREIRIEFPRGNRGFADITLLRRLAEALRHRRARPVRSGKISAAVERIVGRRLEAAFVLPPVPGLGVGGGHPGLRADPGTALADRGVQQFRQRRIERRRIRTRRLGACRPGRVLL